MHWTCKYVGLKYKDGGRGPSEVDCWGLLQFVYRNEFKIDLPSLPGISMANAFRLDIVIDQQIKADWIEVGNPQDGCGVGMSQKDDIHHVGIYCQADGGKIIHAWDRSVVVDTKRGLMLKGFRVIKFYRHRLWPT